MDLRLPREALAKAVARLLGYRRQTDAITERLFAVVDAEVAARRISPETIR